MLKKLINKINIFRIIRNWTHLWDVYDGASKYFVKPLISFRITTHHVYRKPQICFGKYGQYKFKKDGGYWINSITWDDYFLRNCTSFGKWWRKFIKPIYELPMFFKFDIENYGLGYKSKWGEWRFEHNPVFAITIFGVSFVWVAHAPIVNEDYIFHNFCKIDNEESLERYVDYRPCSNDDCYWECILECHNADDNSIGECLRKCNIWTCYYYTKKMEEHNDKVWGEIKLEKDNKKKNKLFKKLQRITVAYFSCSPEYIKPEYRKLWFEIYNDIRTARKDYFWAR